MMDNEQSFHKPDRRSIVPPSVLVGYGRTLCAPGEKAIDTALEKLIDEAEMNGKKSP